MADLPKDLFDGVEDPLRRYALERLPATSLLQLRRANTSAQLLVDQHTGNIWKSVASRLLNPACLPDADNADSVLSILREHGKLLRNFLAGGSSYRLVASTDLRLPKTRKPHWHWHCHWQPDSAVAAGSRWLFVGGWAMNCETKATRDLSHGENVIWTRWCADGLHAIVLHYAGYRAAQRISVCHVESGTRTGSLECTALSREFTRGYILRHSPEMYVSSQASAILVPELQMVSLYKLPSLGKAAQLMGPELAGKPADCYSMGWAASGSLIAVAWQGLGGPLQREIIVTVHSGSDGRLLRQIYMGQLHPSVKFGVCQDQPLAAAAPQDSASIRLLHLDTGILTHLQRPSKWWQSTQTTAVSWAPGGRHMMIQDTSCCHDIWAIFRLTPGDWSRPQYLRRTSKQFHDPTVWSATGLLCFLDSWMIGNCYPRVRNLSASGPGSLLHCDRSTEVTDFDFSRRQWSFVPGTGNLVYLEGGRENSGNNSISHWVYDPSTQRSMRHEVPGFSLNRLGTLDGPGIAWHPKLRSPAIYALAEQRPNGAVHLVDASRHRRLVTWSPQELENILQRSRSGEKNFIFWSLDGRKLAVANKAGTVVLDFASGHE